MRGRVLRCAISLAGLVLAMEFCPKDDAHAAFRLYVWEGKPIKVDVSIAWACVSAETPGPGMMGPAGRTCARTGRPLHRCPSVWRSRIQYSVRGPE